MEPMILRAGEFSPIFSYDLALFGSADFPENIFQYLSRRMARIDEEFRDPFVRVIKQQQTSGLFAVPTGAPDLLIVGFNGIRDIGVNHKPNLAAIDPHSEGISRDNHAF